MNRNKTSKAKQVSSVWQRVWLTLLAAMLTFLAVRPIPLAASPHLQDDNHIILPADGQVVVNFIGTGGPGEPTACTGDFGLYSPQEILIYPDYLYYAGLPFPLPGHFTEDTELVFYITPADFCAGSTYLSTDSDRAIITHPDSNTWVIGWEDWTDADFNDLIVQIDFQPATVSFLDLPYNYIGSTFAEESRDTEQGGKVNAYFDHQYPTYCDPPNTGGCSATDTRAVNFHGYDGDPSLQDQPPYRVVYNGHDGIDYALPHNTPVLAAGDGTVTFASTISLPCDNVNGPSRTIIVSHTNGYETQYWHLDHFAEGIAIGTEVSRDVEQPIGYVGNTGCSNGDHLHFAVKNPDGIVVDPYDWDPRSDAAWYGQTDPWQQWNSEQGNPDATSHYLWIHLLETVALVDPSASTVITSTSSNVVATVPAGAYGAPLRVELAEALPSARIPGCRSLHSFSLAAYTTEDVPVVTLGAEVTLDVHVSTGGVQVLATSVATTPTLQVWDAQTSTWRELPTTWDPLTGSAHATSSQIGTFALTVREYSIYLPVVFRYAH